MYYYLPLLYFGSLFLSYRYNKLQQPFFYSLPYMTTYGTIFYLLTELNYGMVYSYFIPLYYIWVMLQMNNIGIHDSNHKQKLFLTCYEMLNYFKWDIKKETELDKDKQYMFSFHPHGYLSFGFQRMVLLEQLNKELGLTKKTIPLIHKMLFYVPFARELLQYFGSMECSLKNIEHVLLRGHNLGIVLGGVSEMRYIEENTETFYVKPRNGLFDISVKRNVPIVPVVAVRENDTYNLHKYLMTKDFLGTDLHFFASKALMFWMPKKTKIDIIIGNPITETSKAKLKEEYLKELNRIVLKYNYDRKLVFI